MQVLLFCRVCFSPSPQRLALPCVNVGSTWSCQPDPNFVTSCPPLDPPLYSSCPIRFIVRRRAFPASAPSLPGLLCQVSLAAPSTHCRFAAVPLNQRPTTVFGFNAHCISPTVLFSIHSPDQSLDPFCNRARSLTHPLPVATLCSATRSSRSSRSVSPFISTVPSHRIAYGSAPVTMFSSSHYVQLQSLGISACRVPFYGWGSTGRSDRLAIRQGTSPPPLLARRT
jgi:hypothetical protein